MDKKRTSVYIGTPLRKLIGNYQNVSGRLNDVAERYLEIVRDIPVLGSEEELRLIAAALHPAETKRIPGLWSLGAIIGHYADESGMGKASGVDTRRLVAKVNAMSTAEKAALIEYAEHEAAKETT